MHVRVKGNGKQTDDDDEVREAFEVMIDELDDDVTSESRGRDIKTSTECEGVMVVDRGPPRVNDGSEFTYEPVDCGSNDC
jgi:hypothetical protein